MYNEMMIELLNIVLQPVLDVHNDKEAANSSSSSISIIHNSSCVASSSSSSPRKWVCVRDGAGNNTSTTPVTQDDACSLLWKNTMNWKAYTRRNRSQLLTSLLLEKDSNSAAKTQTDESHVAVGTSNNAIIQGKKTENSSMDEITTVFAPSSLLSAINVGTGSSTIG
jgi:hypothetical protein